MLTGAVLEEALFGTVITSTGETSEVEQDWDRFEAVLQCLWWEVEVQCHVAAGCGGIMGQLQELTAKGRDSCGRFERHCH